MLKKIHHLVYPLVYPNFKVCLSGFWWQAQHSALKLKNSTINKYMGKSDSSIAPMHLHNYRKEWNHQRPLSALFHYFSPLHPNFMAYYSKVWRMRVLVLTNHWFPRASQQCKPPLRPPSTTAGISGRLEVNGESSLRRSSAYSTQPPCVMHTNVCSKLCIYWRPPILANKMKKK